MTRQRIKTEFLAYFEDWANWTVHASSGGFAADGCCVDLQTIITRSPSLSNDSERTQIHKVLYKISYITLLLATLDKLKIYLCLEFSLSAASYLPWSG